MKTLLSFAPLIIDSIFILLAGILIIDHEKDLELKASHRKSTRKNKHYSI